MRNSTWNCQETNSTSGLDVSLIQSLEIVKKVKCADFSVTLPLSLELRGCPNVSFWVPFAIARI